MKFLTLFFMCFYLYARADVIPGAEKLFEAEHLAGIKGKRLGLITNQTGVDRLLKSTADKIREHPQLILAALFCPEHGFQGEAYAAEAVQDTTWKGIPLYSLHGTSRRPTVAMLQGIDVLLYDIQCVGARSYTYPSALFYAMEEAAKRGIEVIVLDRPNPINGITLDGPMLEQEFRSYIGYINVPYCHGMTIGELALFFNREYNIGCKLKIIRMEGWERSMSYRDTKLPWIPPSPNIPESDTPFFYSSTGILGALSLVNIGIGYTLPFKIAGAPWINAVRYATKLNEQNLPGVSFYPFYFKPFFGLYKGEECQGVLLHVTDPSTYRPLSVQYLLLGVLKSLYPKEVTEKLAKAHSKDSFHKANGTDLIFKILSEEKYPAWKLLEVHKQEREAFRLKRQKYLLY